MKSTTNNMKKERLMSHPVRGAWIEISMSFQLSGIDSVAPREGCVD